MNAWTSQIPAHLDRARILLAEDEKLTSDFISSFLASLGHDIDVAVNGRDALTKYEKDRYDLVISDINMPEMDGIELIRKIRAFDMDIQIVVMTGSPDVRYCVSALREGIHDYLIKPFELDELSRIVTSALVARRRKKLTYEYKNILERKVFQLDERLRLLFLDAVQSLVNAIEAKDPYTSGHSMRVTAYSMAIAREAGLSDETISEIGLAAQLHDIGKLGISETILNKPTGLTAEEFGLVREHPLTSCQILKPIFKRKGPLEYVRYHHERWKGGGYPESLSGDRIPIGSRVIALADTFDAIISDRAYRPARSKDQALDEILRMEGIQFDPDLVPYMLAVAENRAMTLQIPMESSAS